MKKQALELSPEAQKALAKAHRAWEETQVARADLDRRLEAAGFWKLFESDDGKGWLRMLDLLHPIALDPVVAKSAPAVGFLELVVELAADRMPRPSDSGDESFRVLQSIHAAAAAKRRHHSSYSNARAWVVSEWARERSKYNGNKSRFAHDYASRCADERNTKVTARTIREVWLKG